MKATDQFKATIKKYLDERAKADEQFASAYAKPNKTLDECINFIFQQVQKQGYAGYTDDEVYGMAVHYYDEDDIKDIKPIACRVVVNHVVELSEEDKEEARKEAIERYRDDCYRQEQNRAAEAERKRKEAAKAKAEAKRENQPQQQSLF